MRRIVHTAVVLTLVLLVMALALPAMGADTIDGVPGGEGIMVAPGTPSATIQLVQDLYPIVPAPPENYGGSLIIPD